MCERRGQPEVDRLGSFSLSSGGASDEHDCHTGRSEAYSGRNGRASVLAHYTGRESGILDIFLEYSF
jgi:hypothetical protein